MHLWTYNPFTAHFFFFFFLSHKVWGCQNCSACHLTGLWNWNSSQAAVAFFLREGPCCLFLVFFPLSFEFAKDPLMLHIINQANSFTYFVKFLSKIPYKIELLLRVRPNPKSERSSLVSSFVLQLFSPYLQRGSCVWCAFYRDVPCPMAENLEEQLYFWLLQSTDTGGS